MEQLIRDGNLYVAQPPLYKMHAGKMQEYVYSEAHKERALKRYNGKRNITIQRYKGLGEMNPDQLWETTMNPSTRTLLQVAVDDTALADEVFTRLMGEEVAPRREFIQTHAKSVRNLDV